MGLAVANYYHNGGSIACVCRLADGANSADYQLFFDCELSKLPNVGIIVLPGVAWDDSGRGKLEKAVAHCDLMRNRMVIIDLPNMTFSSLESVAALNLTSSPHAVCYYPWLNVENPVTRNDTITVPPSAFAAGMWAKTDANKGVWRAPAGLEAGLQAVVGLETMIDYTKQDELNPLGINCIRSFPGAGTVIWGSRTLATRAYPEWRYISVRRTAIMIEQSIKSAIQWTCFETNDHRLWSKLRSDIGSFMNGLFRSGAFQGEKISDAYFVRCGLGDTMTQGDIDRGQVIIQVGFAPLKPAEFVIVRIQQKAGQ